MFAARVGRARTARNRSTIVPASAAAMAVRVCRAWAVDSACAPVAGREFIVRARWIIVRAGRVRMVVCARVLAGDTRAAACLDSQAATARLRLIIVVRRRA